MNKSYITPAFIVIEIETEGIITTSPLGQYSTLSTTSTNGSETTDMNINYDGIHHVGIGDGGFLMGK
ncbi:MAG: hypothetical protein IJS20_00075 [Bacteroidales bacterium]|nr:hypothetical protein [Bacteroidales bacterium]